MKMCNEIRAIGIGIVCMCGFLLLLTKSCSTSNAATMPSCPESLTEFRALSAERIGVLSTECLPEILVWLRDEHTQLEETQTCQSSTLKEVATMFVKLTSQDGKYIRVNLKAVDSVQVGERGSVLDMRNGRLLGVKETPKQIESLAPAGVFGAALRGAGSREQDGASGAVRGSKPKR